MTKLSLNYLYNELTFSDIFNNVLKTSQVHKSDQKKHNLTTRLFTYSYCRAFTKWYPFRYFEYVLWRWGTPRKVFRLIYTQDALYLTAPAVAVCTLPLVSYLSDRFPSPTPVRCTPTIIHHYLSTVYEWAEERGRERENEKKNIKNN